MIIFKLLMMTFVIFTFSTAKAVQCMRLLDRLNIQERFFKSLSGVPVRRAEKRLEQDLQAIRNSPQEDFLEEQGFKRSYYAGVDKAREFNRVKKHFQEIKANPKRTHIPYFANQIEQTINEFEKSFRKYNQNNPEFLEEKLKLLEELKKEARKRIEDQNVTYDWWILFHLRLLMITLDSDFIQKMLKMTGYERMFIGSTIQAMDALKTHEGIQDFLSYTSIRYRNPIDVHQDIYREIFGMNIVNRIKKQFPKEMIFFTTSELGIMVFNRLEGDFHFIGISGSFETVDGYKRSPFLFFAHDALHIDATIQSELTLFQKILKRIDNISQSDREKAELVLFIYHHEGGFSFEYELNRGMIGTKEAIRKMMIERVGRFFDSSNDLQKLLPDGVNVNDRHEVERFLIESADVFSEILLAVEP